ncbi:MAG: nucleotidyl transferase AbiEii/AbiGii toxin family protein [Candidatus Micrarchaeota archaeon]
MDERLYLKYKKILEIIEDVAECTDDKLILVGGTALALFYLKHRISIDLDFVPTTKEDEIKLKNELKGKLSKKGYQTLRSAYRNQFVIQFEDTSIKIEIFSPETEIKRVEDKAIGNNNIKVASLEDLLELKNISYASRKEARDLYDIFMILNYLKKDLGEIKKIIKMCGAPLNLEELKDLMLEEKQYIEFIEVINHVA